MAIVPKYPIGKLIRERMKALGIVKAGLVSRLGYGNLARGLRRLDAALRDGEAGPHMLERLPAALEVSRAEVAEAHAATQPAIALDRETARRASFHPHIEIGTETKPGIPAFIQAWFWGNHKRISLPGAFEKLSSREAIRRGGTLVKAHFRENGGEVLVFGKITGYVLRHTFDHAIHLNTRGDVIEPFMRDKQLDPPAMTIGGRKISTGIFNKSH